MLEHSPWLQDTLMLGLLLQPFSSVMGKLLSQLMLLLSQPGTKMLALLGKQEELEQNVSYSETIKWNLHSATWPSHYLD